jgi:hypothetical protein
MTALVVVLGVLVVILAAALVYRSRTPRALTTPRGGRRILLPFIGSLHPRVLDAAIRIAHAEGAVLVPAYLLIVPLECPEDAPLSKEVSTAMPALEAVEHVALQARVAVDARIEKGRTATHALRRLWEIERFDRIVAPAPTARSGGFTPKDLTWILTHAPTETLVLRPSPAEDGAVPSDDGGSPFPPAALASVPSGPAETNGS